MRRALVGFSSPVGYSYKWPAEKSVNDTSSSPNPILMGSMGLFVLYDEIWFACESLCPQSMRGLDYVHFVDRENLNFDPVLSGISEAEDYVILPGEANLNDLFEGGYTDMKQFAGEDGAIDNHTHAVKFFGESVNGNPGKSQLALDIWIEKNLPENYFELILNPITAKIAFGNSISVGLLQEESYNSLKLADKIISLRNIYDVTGREGPYHPCIEEIRNDDLIVNFRKWISKEGNRLDNRELADIQEDVDDKLFQLKEKALDKYIESYRLKNVLVDLIKGGISEIIGAPFSIVEYLAKFPEINEQKAYTFLARSHLRQEKAFKS